MKYAFKNQSNQSLTEIELTSFQLIIRQQGKERVIPYSTITNVRLECKRGGFFMTLHSLDFGSIRISNRSLNDSGKWEDQSRLYQTFVRVLHLHLSKTQCEAEFCSGFKPAHLPTKFILVIILSSLLYFVEEYVDLLATNPLITALSVLGAGTLLLAAPLLKSPPKHYEPSDIPLNMLPPAA